VLETTQPATAEDASGECCLLKEGDPLERQPCLRALLMRCVFPPFEPPDGGRPRFFCLVIVVGNATSRKLVPFSHRSASRIFVRQPDCFPSPVGNLVERSEPGCGLRPALSFKDFRHPG
jgi:hypothetical protein